MDRREANRLCRAAGVNEVPSGVDPQDWLDDNDVFGASVAEQAEDAQAEIVREVFASDRRQSNEDHDRIGATIDRLRMEGFFCTTALGVAGLEWTMVDHGVWSAKSSAPNNLYEGHHSPRLSTSKAIAYRHDYGNARVYFVPASLVDSSLEAWWADTLRTGYRTNSGDPVAGVQWAARRALELADKFAHCLGGEDAVRFVSKVGREKLERLAAL